MEICACPQCGLPAEVVDGDGLPEREVGASAVHSPARSLDLVGVRCVGRHWFFGARERLVA